jgi:hypothetical protein
MKIKIILFTLLAITAIVIISMKTLSAKSDGPHGGKVKAVEKFNIETKIVFPRFYAYLLNDKLEPINNKGMTCEIQFSFPDSIQTSLPLKPEGTDGFSIETSVSDYSSYRVTFMAFGKPISAKFENESLLVKGN